MADGRKVIEASLGNVSAAGVEKIVAVARPDADLISVLQVSGCEVAINHDANLGMGTSIAVGVAATAHASGWIIALGDMPSINAGTIFAISEALARGAAIAVPVMNGRRGHPVGFSAHYFEKLTALSGDTGARGLMQADAAFVEEISVNDSGIFADIDTPQDLKR
jgi:molybdenum cofactor cytidylyltransferase